MNKKQRFIRKIQTQAQKNKYHMFSYADLSLSQLNVCIQEKLDMGKDKKLERGLCDWEEKGGLKGGKWGKAG